MYNIPQDRSDSSNDQILIKKKKEQKYNLQQQALSIRSANRTKNTRENGEWKARKGEKEIQTLNGIFIFLKFRQTFFFLLGKTRKLP